MCGCHPATKMPPRNPCGGVCGLPQGSPVTSLLRPHCSPGRWVSDQAAPPVTTRAKWSSRPAPSGRKPLLGRAPSGPGPQGSWVCSPQNAQHPGRCSENIGVQFKPNTFKRRYRLPPSGSPTPSPRSVLLLRGPPRHTSPRVSACWSAGSDTDTLRARRNAAQDAPWTRWARHALTQKDGV